jgi:uncharacterized protein YktB (UPF0637 family)
MMATLGFLRRDFEVFAIKDVDARLAKIELVTPRLMVLVAQFKWRQKVACRYAAPFVVRRDPQRSFKTMSTTRRLIAKKRRAIRT